VHAGVALMCVALIGARFAREADVSLVPGAEAEVRDALGQRWRFVSEGVYDLDQFNRRVRGVGIQAWRGASRVGLVKSERRQYIDRFGNPIDDPVVVAGLLNTTAEGVHVVLSGDHEDEDHVEVRITFDPLVSWIWLGAALVMVGGVLAIWPLPDRTRVAPAAPPNVDPQAGA
jgi:cytochrome c-type biogenesis protein CcmF